MINRENLINITKLRVRATRTPGHAISGIKGIGRISIPLWCALFLDQANGAIGSQKQNAKQPNN